MIVFVILSSFFLQCYGLDPETTREIERPIVSPLKMGIEIETSAVKIYSPDRGCIIGFTITTLFGKTWMIEEDTSDNTFYQMPPYAEYNQNLEFKTIGGFNQEEIIEVGGQMQKLLEIFHTRARPTLEIDDKMVRELLDNLEVMPKPRNPPKVSLKAKIEDKSIRPQITYQIPLFLLPQVFKHLEDLGHPKIRDFLECLIPIIPPELNEEGIQRRLKHDRLMMRNVGHDKYVQLFLKRAIAENMNRMPVGNAKGFCYLLLYYWYAIFNNKENPLESSEPGPKKSLAILSRIPLSQLFDSLDDSDKERVLAILSPIIESDGEKFKIAAYSDYDGNTVNSSLTLKDWYQSVVDPRFRQEIKGRRVDLLSPPPELKTTTYSMGYLDIARDSSGFALIEVRGYATLSIGRENLEIGTIRKLVGIESDWFFKRLILEEDKGHEQK